MKNVFSVKLEKTLLQKLKDYCQARGVKQGFFVERALQEKLEREETVDDIAEIKQLRSGEGAAMLFSDYDKRRS